MDNSVLYGLSNPAFTEDYASSMFFRQFPTNIDPIDGLGNYQISRINPGQPAKDTYQKKQGKSHFVKNALITAGVAAAIFAGIKFLPKILPESVKKLFGKAGTPLKKGISKISDFFKNIFHKIKK